MNFAGNPALATPIPVNDRTIPVTSLQLVGPRLSEAELLNAGRLVEAAVQGSIHGVTARKSHARATIKSLPCPFPAALSVLQNRQ
jgi:Asp-tRNA(Asn)/Glu-tRNA(Gln) amidotransferase A subunit family amidase